MSFEIDYVYLITYIALLRNSGPLGKHGSSSSSSKFKVNFHSFGCILYGILAHLDRLKTLFKFPAKA